MTGVPLTVYYDGACPVCRCEIAGYRQMRGASGMRWVDVATCERPDLGEGLDRKRALYRFHVRLTDGRLVSGASAFIAVWRDLPALGWLVHLFYNPPGRWMLNIVYAAFLRARPLWRT